MLQKTFLANLRGLPGLNATGAAEDSAAVGQFLDSPPQLSAARRKLTRQMGYALTHDFTKDPNGAVPALDTGQASHLSGNQPAVIVDGALVQIPSTGGPVASYLTASLGKPLRRIGCEWTFQGGVGASGLLTLIGWQTDFNGPVPAANAHVIIRPDYWSFGIIPPYSTGGPQQEVLASFKFKTPLAAGVLQRAEVIIDPDRGEAHLFLPDGSTYTVRDDRIRTLSGMFPAWEHLSTSTTAEKPVRITRIWADGEVDTPGAIGGAFLTPARAHRRELLVGGLDTSANGTVTSTGSFVQIDKRTIVIPPSRKALVQAWQYVQTGGSAQSVYFQTRVGGGDQYGHTAVVSTAGNDGPRSFTDELDLSAFTPGTEWEVSLWMLATNAIRVQNAGNNIRNSLIITPLP